MPGGSPVGMVSAFLDGRRTVANSLLAYWYYHLPNFVLAALMYTLLGRVLLGLIMEPESSNYIWRFFCRFTDPVISLVALVTPKAVPSVIHWLFGFVWLFWIRVAFDYAIRWLRLAPPVG